MIVVDDSFLSEGTLTESIKRKWAEMLALVDQADEQGLTVTVDAEVLDCETELYVWKRL